jgi:hypothetical protein
MALLISGQFVLALTIAVFALIVLYFLHSLAYLLLPRWNPQLYSEIRLTTPRWILTASALISLLAMGAMIVVQVVQDVEVLRTQSLSYRIDHHTLTSVELMFAWGLIGIALYAITQWREKQTKHASQPSTPPASAGGN